ncbi:CG42562 [Drosophila busckii]|uniref:CG42562 n=1 Tax=Drosophila busckii TaxID=30019 RepID=A0A0M4EGG3_DROBS|nr:CG42562 [Drosophila busckii]
MRRALRVILQSTAGPKPI